jgi:hypothetical protein
MAELELFRVIMRIDRANRGAPPPPLDGVRVTRCRTCACALSALSEECPEAPAEVEGDDLCAHCKWDLARWGADGGAAGD